MSSVKSNIVMEYGFHDELDIDEIMYRLYVRQKLETAEKDVREGRVISHEEVVRETSIVRFAYNRK